jgi:hypothetical protein
MGFVARGWLIGMQDEWRRSRRSSDHPDHSDPLEKLMCTSQTNAITRINLTKSRIISVSAKVSIFRLIVVADRTIERLRIRACHGQIKPDKTVFDCDTICHFMEMMVSSRVGKDQSISQRGGAKELLRCSVFVYCVREELAGSGFHHQFLHSEGVSF